MKKQALILLGILCGIVFGSQAQTYRGMVDVGAAIELPLDCYVTKDYSSGALILEDYGYDAVVVGLAVSTTHGVQINKNHFLGVGVEFSRMMHTFDEMLGSIPVYAMWRMDFFGRQITPFFDVRVGYQVADATGFYGNVNGGIRIGLSRRSGLNLSLGVRMRRVTLNDDDNYDNGSWISPINSSGGPKIMIKENVYGVLLRIGVDF